MKSELEHIDVANHVRLTHLLFKAAANLSPIYAEVTRGPQAFSIFDCTYEKFPFELTDSDDVSIYWPNSMAHYPKADALYVEAKMPVKDRDGSYKQEVGYATIPFDILQKYIRNEDWVAPLLATEMERRLSYVAIHKRDSEDRSEKETRETELELLRKLKEKYPDAI